MILIEKELREEAEEIARLLNDDNSDVSFSVCLLSMVGCFLVVLCGIIPALLLPVNKHFHYSEGRRSLNLLLSFAVGSLLGDVFLHLLPATWNDCNGMCRLQKGVCSLVSFLHKNICAIMNLAANLVDNFTHGLAVGASFSVSPKFGMMTTFAILVHEIPHEVSDFAILLRADFNRMQAVKAQFVTASGGVAGACMALWMKYDLTHSVDWVLPFTAGGFINIALAQILPELNRELDRR
ncbi:unnamed protein product [Heligmosomoides polygyrus]|uniref:Zinc transporter ZIP13 n=1 Tax=Heligmosomoides polygyrus TaxID=6339 RepID=A0A3P8GPC6_HELPZ|nr:unnamed protein product [Heligmosomoides polygyrus]